MNAYNMNQYQQNQVGTASPEQILLMLYDGAIRFTREAIGGIEENKPELRRHGVSKAMAIITEFSNSLDHEIGGKIAEDLDALYDFMVRELTSANLNSDVEKLKVVEKLLVDLRQTWGEAVAINKKKMVSEVAEVSPNNSQSTYTPSKMAKAASNNTQETYTPFSISR